ncbi:MAG: hypothetical protein K2J80_13945, partial [Oscillospiraceae bacterium]|nr:hypothetical protein [Oscillospiraceae bacterium]
TVTGLSENTTYNFRVFAFKGSNYSQLASVSATTRSTARSVLAPPVSSAARLMNSRTMLKGIDVSGWQGNIDFKAVKESGIDFVIVKAGESDFTVESWERNYAGAKEVGLMVGAYWYSQAVTIEEGKTEARTFIKALSGKRFEFPVYFDIEESKQFDLGMDFCTRLVDAFCGELENAGYCAGVYCSTYWYTNYVNDQVRVKRPTWIAEYNRACNYGGSYGIWQHSCVGRVSGIAGDVDLNWGYIDYSKYIKANKCSGY